VTAFEAKLVSKSKSRPLLCRKTALRLAIAGALLAAAAPVALAQYTAAEEAARRRAVLDRLPQDAAQRLFGLAATPAPGPARVIGFYSKGCLAGGAELPADGPNWQVMRPSRNRAWGHPVLIAFLQRLAAAGAAAGWPGLLVGDLAQPRGGPMLTGHASHQLGIEADLWLTPMPERRLSPAERDEMPATNVVAENLDDIDTAVWRPEHKKLLETAAPRSRRRPRLAAPHPAGGGAQLSFPRAPRLPARRAGLSGPGRPAAGRRLRHRARLVVYPGGAAPEAARPSETPAHLRPAARLRRPGQRRIGAAALR
jgi:hypothetical protein